MTRESAEHNGPVVLVYQFKEDLKWAQEKYPDARVLGNGASKKQAALAAEEWNSGRLNVLVLHPASAGHGCNFQFGGNRIVFIGPIWSRDQTDQVIARLRRRGCPYDAVHVTFIVARDTVEDHVVIPRVLREGESAQTFRQYLQALS